MPARKLPTTKSAKGACSLRFEAANIDGLYPVLDAIAWLKLPVVGQVAQFAGIDPRTAGKLLKNAATIGLIETVNETQFSLRLAYPHKGAPDQKRAVVREALVRMPFLQDVRQFLQLGDTLDAAVRKAAAVQNVQNFDPAALGPLVQWAKQLDALQPGLDVEELLDSAVEAKEERHRTEASKKVVFLSHSSKDKPFIRKLATDLTAEGVSVWLDEQNIRVGESIPDRIAQGLAESDYFAIALSDDSVRSEWVKRELNQAMVSEIERRQVSILPLLLSDTEIPPAIKDKKYADFRTSYKQGLGELSVAIGGKEINNS